MNMNNVFKYKCVSNLQVKPGYTRKSPGIPEKYPSARPHAAHLLPGSLRQLRRAPSAQVRAPHHVCSLQVPKRKRQHRRQARLAGGGADDAVVPTFCYKIEAVLRMRLCDPDQLIGKKRRNKLTAADTLFATSRDVSLFGEDEHDSGFTDTRWVAGARRAVRELRKSRLNSALKKHRKTEQEAADKAIVELGM